MFETGCFAIRSTLQVAFKLAVCRKINQNRKALNPKKNRGRTASIKVSPKPSNRRNRND